MLPDDAGAADALMLSPLPADADAPRLPLCRPPLLPMPADAITPLFDADAFSDCAMLRAAP